MNNIYELIVGLFSWFIVPWLVFGIQAVTLIYYETSTVITGDSIDTVEEDIQFTKYGRTIDEMYEDDGFALKFDLFRKMEFLEYKIAIWRFPTAESCIVADNDGNKDTDNFSPVAWDKIKNFKEAEICMFRIHNRIGDPQASLEWFEREGFFWTHIHNDPLSPVPADTFWGDEGEVSLTNRISVDASWGNEIDEGEAPLTSIIFRLTGLGAVTSFGVSLEDYRDGKWKAVEVGFSYL